MENFAGAFVRNPDGSWLCRKRVHVVGPYGPFTIREGTTYRAGEAVLGYDIGNWLDDWITNKTIPIGVEFL